MIRYAPMAAVRRLVTVGEDSLWVIYGKELNGSPSPVAMHVSQTNSRAVRPGATTVARGYDQWGPLIGRMAPCSTPASATTPVRSDSYRIGPTWSQPNLLPVRASQQVEGKPNDDVGSNDGRNRRRAPLNGLGCQRAGCRARFLYGAGASRRLQLLSERNDSC